MKAYVYFHGNSITKTVFYKVMVFGQLMEVMGWTQTPVERMVLIKVEADVRGYI